MGLLSKLLGDSGKDIEKSAKDLLNGIKNEAQKQGIKAEDILAGKNNAEAPSKALSEAPGQEVEEIATEPFGSSGGSGMPDEENQFSYNGPFTEYFENIFHTEFPEYQVEREDFTDGKRIVYTFTKEGKKALVVELLTRYSTAYKQRQICKETGVPYLRYYYDCQEVEGWWNTRSYVVTRTRNALGGE